MNDTFLMCPPRYFGVKYVINPWMEGNIDQTDHATANRQWQDFYHHLKQHAEVLLLEPDPELPDMVFTANPGLIKDNRVVLSRFRHHQRQAEVAHFKQWFTQKGYDVLEIPDAFFFEGAGDALFQPGQDLLWMGYGFRSDLAACDYLKTHLATPVLPLKLVDEQFYHLDTCFCPLLNNAALYFPDAFDTASHHRIEAHIPKDKRLIASEEDALQFACNAVLVTTNETPLIFMNTATPALKNQLTELGYRVVIQPMTEFNKSGGANRCTVLQLPST